MVKKIKLDFSKVEERSGWNTKQMPEGLHAFKIVSVEDKEASDGTDMWVFALVPESDRYKTRRFPFYCKLQQNQLWKLRDLFVAAGVAVPKRAQMIDPNKVIGKVIAAEVEDETGQYAGRSTINGTYSLDILDEEDGAADADEDDEEYEGDEAEEEEYEDDEADDEEDYEDEDDEDDLDDEDLEDEEDEDFEDEEDDEEEEPEPAPRKRTSSKKPTAKKAPAKKAAPARRVVKRR